MNIIYFLFFNKEYMDSESLNIFCTVAAELSITRAATRLGRVPSNVTTRIQQLEADIGADLFVRSGKRLSLSSAGERLLGYAQRMLALEDEARQVVTGGRTGGVLRIGSMESTAASRLPAVLSDYHACYPDTRLEVSTGPSRRLLEQVRTGVQDCAFVALPAGEDAQLALDDMDLAQTRLWREELLMLTPVVEADKAPDAWRVRSLAAFPQGCTYRALAEDWLSVPAMPGWAVQEMGSYHAMVACVAAGACVTVLPRSVLALAGDVPGVTARHMTYAATSLVWRQGYAAPAFQRLLDLLAEQLLAGAQDEVSRGS